MFSRRQLAAMWMKRRGTYAYSRSQPGRQNGMWVERPKYSALHEWIRNHKPRPKLCEVCHKNEATEIANISGKYKRDVGDYKWVCRSCHGVIDDRIKNMGA